MALHPSARLRPAVAIAVALQLAAAAPAATAESPTPCNGLAGSDPAGDQTIVWGADPRGDDLSSDPPAETPEPLRAGPSTDLTSLFFRVDSARVTVNLVLTELTTSLPAYATAIVYSAYYGIGSGTEAYFVRATVRAASTRYEYGTSYQEAAVAEGETGGELFPGPKGVVQIEIPAAQAGTEIKATRVKTAYLTAEGPRTTDVLADTDFHTTAPCPGTEPPGEDPSDPPGDPGPGDPGPGDPGPGPREPDQGQTPGPPVAGPAQPAARVQAPPLRLVARGTTQSARAIARRRALTLRLATREPLTRLRAELARGTAVVARARLKRLTGTATLRLPLKRRLRPGRYELRLTAARQDGSTGALTVAVTVRR